MFLNPLEGRRFVYPAWQIANKNVSIEQNDVDFSSEEQKNSKDDLLPKSSTLGPNGYINLKEPVLTIMGS